MDLASGTIEFSIEEVQRLKTIYSKKDDVECIDDALFHLRRARESLSNVRLDEETIKMFAILMPYIFLWTRQLTHPHSSP